MTTETNTTPRNIQPETPPTRWRIQHDNTGPRGALEYWVTRLDGTDAVGPYAHLGEAQATRDRMNVENERRAQEKAALDAPQTFADILRDVAPGTAVIVHLGLIRGTGPSAGQPVSAWRAREAVREIQDRTHAIATIEGPSRSPWGEEPAVWIAGVIPDDVHTFAAVLEHWRRSLEQKAIGLTLAGRYVEGGV